MLFRSAAEGAMMFADLAAEYRSRAADSFLATVDNAAEAATEEDETVDVDVNDSVNAARAAMNSARAAVGQAASAARRAAGSSIRADATARRAADEAADLAANMIPNRRFLKGTVDNPKLVDHVWEG